LTREKLVNYDSNFKKPVNLVEVLQKISKSSKNADFASKTLKKSKNAIKSAENATNEKPTYCATISSLNLRIIRPQSVDQRQRALFHLYTLLQAFSAIHKVLVSGQLVTKGRSH
jgi:hypothetical protein